MVLKGIRIGIWTYRNALKSRCRSRKHARIKDPSELFKSVADHDMLLQTLRVSTTQSALPISRLSRTMVLLNGCSNASLKRNYATSGSSPLISAGQLKKAIESSPRPVLLDCTWFMPNVPRNAFAEFKQSRIPGARFFNLDEVIDKASPYPHMLPSAEDFAKAVGTWSFLLY